jgi:hypothetical protein
MARTRYTAEEIICHLRIVEIEAGKGIGIADACRKLGITEQTYYPVAERIRRLARGSGQTAEGPGAGACATEALGGRSLARQ